MSSVGKPTAEGWLDRAVIDLSQSPDFVAEGMALDIAEQIVAIMEMKDISRAKLSDDMGVSRAYVSQVLNAPPNLTLRTIAAVAIALGARPKVNILTSVPAPFGHAGVPDAAEIARAYATTTSQVVASAYPIATNTADFLSLWRDAFGPYTTVQYGVTKARNDPQPPNRLGHMPVQEPQASLALAS